MQHLAGSSRVWGPGALWYHREWAGRARQGMGEGEGAKDVSDQITDEDQLLGARQKDQPPPEQVGALWWAATAKPALSRIPLPLRLAL